VNEIELNPQSRLKNVECSAAHFTANVFNLKVLQIVQLHAILNTCQG